MSETVTVRKIGNSLGLILPKSTIEGLNVAEGDMLHIVRTPDGIRLMPYDPNFGEALDATRDYMRRHRDALRALAK
jgi:putative addiction module antidote